MTEELIEMAKEYGFKTTEEMVANINMIASDIVATLISMSDPDVSARLYKLFKDHPKISGAITMVFYGFGITAIAFGFSVFKNMTPLEKAAFCESIADIFVKSINDVTVIAAFKVFKKGIGDFVGAENDILKSISKADFIEVIAQEKDVANVIERLGVTGLEDVGKAGEFWLKFARITTKVAKGLMFLTVAVSLGVTGYQIYEDIKNGETPGVTALDCLKELADGVFFVTEAISCLASSVCAAIPIIGIVAAAVGIILAIVSIFVKRKAPEPPIAGFVRDRLVPFVNGLGDVPYEGLDKHPAPKDDELPQRLLRISGAKAPPVSGDPIFA